MIINPPPDEMTALKQQLATVQKENQNLKQKLTQQKQTIIQLNRWLMGLQRAIDGIHHSFTWQIGDKITQFILKLMQRKAGPTAFNQINSLSSSFHYWLTHFRKKNKAQQCTLYTQDWYVPAEYQAWFNRYFNLNELDKKNLIMQVNILKPLPEVAIIIYVDIYLTNLTNTLNTIFSQFYSNWCVILIAPDIIKESIQPFLAEKIHTLFIHEKETYTLNEAILALTAPYFIILNSGDQLPNYSLCKIVQAIKQAPEAIFWYSDHDCIGTDGQIYAPYFKPDWSPDLFYSCDYLQGAIIFNTQKVKYLKNLAELTKEKANTWVYGLVLSLLSTEQDNMPFHIPFILFNKAVFSMPTQADAERLLKNYFFKLKKTVNITALKSPTIFNIFRVHYTLPDTLPLVSIIIPIKDKVELLENLIAGLLRKTDYNNIEVIIIDNQSKDSKTLNYLSTITKTNIHIKCLTYPKPFNYAHINNWGVQQAKGEIIALLNNDLEIIHTDWLKELVAHALRPEVGAVGAKLYYPDDTIQHAGVHTSNEGIGWHILKHFPREDLGYYGKLQLIQNYSAVTAACLVMRKTIFEQVQGFDEQLKVAFNDVDLCLKLRQLGYYIVWTPFAELYHLESVSRGYDTSIRQHLRLRQELVTMQNRWQSELANDPFYHPHLDTKTETYQLAYPPRNGLV